MDGWMDQMMDGWRGERKDGRKEGNNEGRMHGEKEGENYSMISTPVKYPDGVMMSSVTAPSITLHKKYCVECPEWLLSHIKKGKGVHY